MLYLPTYIVYNNNNNNIVRVRVKINILYTYSIYVTCILYILYIYISAERVCCIRTIYNDIVLSGRQ